MGRRGAIVGVCVAAIACNVPGEGGPSAQTVGDGSSGTDTQSEASGPGTHASGESGSSTIDPDTEGSPTCGNGALEPGEVCDDGNEVDADGCNIDCRQSGIVLFELVFDPAPIANEEVRDIDEAEDGTYVVGGWVMGMGRDAWVARLTQDDELMWEATVVANAYDDQIFGVSAGEGGKTFAAGVVDEYPSNGDPWLGAITATGSVSASEQYASPYYGRWFDVEDVGGGVVVVGQHDDASGYRGLVRTYDDAILMTSEVEPVVAGPGLMFGEACATKNLVLVAGLRSDAASITEGLTVLLDGAATQWVGTSQAAGGHSFITGCAVSGDGEARRYFATGYDTATEPQWLGQLHARDRMGEIVIEMPTYVGEADLGAFYSDVEADAAGNVIVAGGTLTGSSDFEWVPVVRKYDPSGKQLWSRTIMPNGFPFGAIEAVTTTAVGEIRLAGYATDATGLRHRWLARMTP